MNSLESVKALIIDYLKELASGNISESLVVSEIDVKKDRDVYDAFFNLIADTTNSPESIIHLDTYISGIDGFSTSLCLQIVIGFACFDALAIRKPEILYGPWETVVWMIVKYLSFANTYLGNGRVTSKKPNETTLKFIIELGSPKLCPNPCLRLELSRFIRSCNCRELYYDRESYRNDIIKTLFEMCDDKTTFTVDQLPNFSPMDLEILMEDNFIDMGYVMEECKLETKKFKIIAIVLKLTRKLALLEKEKHQRSNKGTLDGIRLGALDKQLSICLSFCGLLSDADLDADLENFIHVAGNNNFY